MKPALIAHWRFEGNAADAAGNHPGTARNVKFSQGPPGTPGGSAVFDGRDSVIEVADAPDLRLGPRDFTIAAWVKCRRPVRGPYGDIVSKFDPSNRCGINFSVSGTTPAYSGMTDQRHVHFGMDDGYLGGWTDCGRPWPSNPLVSTLVPFEGELYAGITDADDPRDACRVFRRNGKKNWVDCGRLGKDPNHLSVMSLCVHDGKLCAGTGVWDWVRAGGCDFKPALSHVFVYDGGTSWTDLGQVGASVRVLCMASFEGHLYAGLDRTGGGHCYRLDGGQWVDCGGINGDNVENLLALNGRLYAATHGILYRYDGGKTWTCIGKFPHGITQIHSLEAFGGMMVVGSWPQGYVLRMDPDGSWPVMGRLGIQPRPDPSCPGGVREINEINDLIVHNGKL